MPVTTAMAKENTKTEPEDRQAKSEFVNPSVLSLGSYSVDPVIGQTVTSWTDRAGKTLAGCARSYRVTDLLHIGSSSLVVELEEQSGGEKYAGQTLSGKLRNALSAEKLALWAQGQMSINSRHLVRIYDLANINGHFFIVREHLPLSLSDLLAAGVEHADFSCREVRLSGAGRPWGTCIFIWRQTAEYRTCSISTCVPRASFCAETNPISRYITAASGKR